MAPDATAACFYCGKTWPLSRMYAKRDKPAGTRIGYTCQDLTACRHRSGADKLVDKSP